MTDRMDNGIMLDTPKDMGWFRFMLGYKALHLEANTGMKMTRGFRPVKFFADYGFKSKRLPKLLQEVQAYIHEQAEAGQIPSDVFKALKYTL